MNRNTKNILLALGLIALAVVSRMTLHIPNFAAVAAVGLFAGFYFRGFVAYLIPLTAVLISDLFIGFYEPGVVAFVYVAWLIPVVIGKWKLSIPGVNKYLNRILVVGSKSLLASVGFYLVSNLGVWLFSGMYVTSFAGLIECYTLAIPFFRQTLFGDLFFTGALFGVYHLFQLHATNKKEVAPVYLKK